MEVYSTEDNCYRRGMASRPSGVEWTSELIRLEIALWDRVNARLQESHELSLAFFEPLHVISGEPEGSMRVGDLARELRITVGGASKLVDRMEKAELIAREPDPDDRRASRVALTAAGKRKLNAAVKSYEAEVAAILRGVLSPDEQRQMSRYASRLLTAIDEAEGE
jgi:DNA-binding MarR family transcriptional regulator